MTPLESIIKQIIAQDGPISVARFMELCLAHPVHGYYMTRDPFGCAGDFTTAPEISQMFGELIGLWAADTWQKMGAPAKIALVELGPGRGTLMSDALRAAKSVPTFSASLEVHLVEISPILRESQRNTLANYNVTWHQSIDTLPACPTLIIANEFFDAFPIRQFMKQSTGWHERLVGLNEVGDLIFGLSPQQAVEVLPSTLVGEGASKRRVRGINNIPTYGSIFEISEASRDVAYSLYQHLKSHSGAALFVDYGHIKSGVGDTLQALKAHKMVSPLEAIGEADLTAHVDFEALSKAAIQAGINVQEPITQAAFFKYLGIEHRATTLVKSAKTEQQKQDIETALQRLTNTTPTGMGSLFKVLEIYYLVKPS
jgi:NADH dehydrogenase [ubiquinone] 1 alpha subcomplex assembly factor 7